MQTRQPVLRFLSPATLTPGVGSMTSWRYGDQGFA
ncbi:hypothetical protein LEMLEM_LOCUS13397, partial [Lemmus lemmus]